MWQGKEKLKKNLNFFTGIYKMRKVIYFYFMEKTSRCVKFVSIVISFSIKIEAKRYQIFVVYQTKFNADWNIKMIILPLKKINKA